MSSKFKLCTRGNARISSIFGDNQIIYNKCVDLLRQMPLPIQNFGHILTDFVDAVLVGDELALDVLTLQRAAQLGGSGR